MKKVVVIILLVLTTGTMFAQKNTGTENAFGNTKQVRFFPNPATTSINFEFKNAVEKGSVLQVYSFLGRKMANLSIPGSRMVVNLSDYITGIYVFQVRDASGRLIETNKFQVAK